MSIQDKINAAAKAGAAEEVKSEDGSVQSVGLTDEELANMTEKDIMNHPSILAMPLHFNSDLELKPIRREYHYRWVNFRVKEGMSLNRHLSLGFTYATTEDVKILNEHMVKDKGKKIEAGGELVAMKIKKDIYYGMIKANVMRAEELTSPKALRKVGEQEGENVISGIRGRVGTDMRGRPKVGIYHPPIGELDKNIGG
jgi:hypothetical protein